MISQIQIEHAGPSDLRESVLELDPGASSVPSRCDIGVLVGWVVGGRARFIRLMVDG